jgi:hypothetical protein
MNNPDDKKKRPLEEIDIFLLEDQGYWEDPRPDYEIWEENQCWADISAGEGQEDYYDDYETDDPF